MLIFFFASLLLVTVRNILQLFFSFHENKKFWCLLVIFFGQFLVEINRWSYWTNMCVLVWWLDRFHDLATSWFLLSFFLGLLLRIWFFASNSQKVAFVQSHFFSTFLLIEISRIEKHANVYPKSCKAKWFLSENVMLNVFFCLFPSSDAKQVSLPDR